MVRESGNSDFMPEAYQTACLAPRNQGDSSPEMKRFSRRLLRPLWVLIPGLAAMPAMATVYTVEEGGSGLFGREERVVTRYEDTLFEIARRFSLGSEEVVRVNPGMDPWLPGANRQIVIPGQRILPPGPREGIVVNLPEHRLYFYPKPVAGQPQRVYTYPVSIGKMDWHTPLGRTTITQKRERPTWSPPESVRKEHIARGEPPLRPWCPPARTTPWVCTPCGGHPGRGLPDPRHKQPDRRGMAVTHGCIRMYPEDIAELFPMVAQGTPVYLVNEPVKVAFIDGQLVLEAHPPVDAQGQTREPDLTVFEGLLEQALGENPVAIHWDRTRTELGLARGMPVVVGLAAQPMELNAAPNSL